MLTFRKIEDDKLWDDLVQTLPSYTFLNSSARYKYYKEIGTDAFRIGIYKENTFLGIIACIVGYSKLFGKFLECKHSPILIESREEYWREILEQCKKIAEENSCFMIRFSPLYTENKTLIKFYKTHSFKLAPIHNVDALVTQHIDLTKDIEEIKKGIARRRRSYLNRLLADTENVRVKIFDDNSQFEVFDNLRKQTIQLKKYIDKSSELLEKELQHQINNSMCYFVIGYYKKKPIGVWQCSVYGENIHFYQAGTDTGFRNKNFNITELLYWECVKLGQQLGCKTFDLFGGIVPDGCNKKRHPWGGIGDFKERLGGRKVTYLHSRDYPIKKIKYALYYIYSWFRTTRRGYPVKW